MKRIPIIFALLALCVSCEYDFELEDGKLETKLYVNCVARNADSTFVTVQKCVPVNRSVNANAELPDLEYLSLYSGDKKLTLQHKEDSPFNRWYTLDKIDADAPIRIEAKAKDSGRIEAVSQMPAAPAIKSVKTDFCKINDEYLEVEIELEDKDAASGYYAVTYYEHTQESYEYDPELNPFEQDDFYGDYIFSSHLYSLIRPTSSGILTEDTEDYPYLYWNQKTLDHSDWGDYIESLCLFSNKVMESNKGVIKFALFYRDDYDAINEYDAYMGDGNEGRVRVHEKRAIKRKYKVYRISEEFYHYAMAIIAQDADSFAELGLAPSNFAYTNIKEGFGVLAGCAGAETDWFDNI